MAAVCARRGWFPQCRAGYGLPRLLQRLGLRTCQPHVGKCAVPAVPVRPLHSPLHFGLSLKNATTLRRIRRVFVTAEHLRHQCAAVLRGVEDSHLPILAVGKAATIELITFCSLSPLGTRNSGQRILLGTCYHHGFGLAERSRQRSAHEMKTPRNIVIVHPEFFFFFVA